MLDMIDLGSRRYNRISIHLACAVAADSSTYLYQKAADISLTPSIFHSKAP
jgi:hypothetical protein